MKIIPCVVFGGEKCGHSKEILCASFGREKFDVIISFSWRLFGELKKEGKFHFESLGKCCLREKWKEMRKEKKIVISF